MILDHSISDDIPPQINILNMVKSIQILMHFCRFVSNWSIANITFSHIKLYAIQHNMT